MRKQRIVQDSRHHHLRLRPIVAALMSMGLISATVQAAPEGGVVRAGTAHISGGGALTRIEQASQRAVIDWRSFGIGAAERVQFVQPSAQAATLNRVTGEQASVILGRLDANGQVLLINPHGIVFGRGAQVNVGSLIASTSNISNTDFMAGRLAFTQPGRPGAGILNAGTITAAEGGLVALVAPHVRNDGLIQARLGKVALGAADTFTIDLYGDTLVNLALSDVHLGQLRDTEGRPVTSLITQAGQIDAAGGQVVLVTAATAKTVLDSLINMSGTIRADAAVQEGGNILLLGEGGRVEVSGTLSAQGEHGGRIGVYGTQVDLASSARLDASGGQGGGVIHVGGAWQGGGDAHRAQQTAVEAGAVLSANAVKLGHGGEVVVWSDGHTAFGGAVEAKGGALGGDGGRMEVSGKGTLDFTGSADASAPKGAAGLLLLDPAYFNVGLAEASLISRVLRTGTSTTLAADIDVNINSLIDGRGRYAGGGLTMTAGNNININDFVLTNNGAINLNAAAGTVNIAPGKAVYAGTAPITASAGGTLRTGPLLTGGALSLASTGGSVVIDFPIDGAAGLVTINAAIDVDIDQPVLNMRSGNALNVTAGRDVNINTQVDGRGGVPGGAATMTAGRHINLNQSIVSDNGAISLTAQSGALTMAAGEGLFAGSAPISLTSGATLGIAPGLLSTTGALSLRSTANAVNIDQPIDNTTGAVTINAATAVNVNQSITNLKTGSNLTITAGTDIHVNAQIDGRDGTAAGGSVTLTAGNHLRLFDHITTNNGPINLTTITGSVFLAPVAQDVNLLITAPPKQVRAGNAPITIVSGGDFSTGAPPPQPIPTPTLDPGLTLEQRMAAAKDYVREFLKQYVQLVTTGTLNITSTNGNVNIIAPISDATGPVTITAGNAINVRHKINSDNQPITLNGGSGGINVFEVNDSCGITECFRTSPVDARLANLTLNSIGDVAITGSGVATAQTLIIDTRGRILTGSIGDTSDGTRPSTVVLIADGGIPSFNVGKAGDVSATSIGGSINLGVFFPDKLRITTGTPDPNNPTASTDCTDCNIATGGFLGPDVVLNAGGSVTVGNFIGDNNVSLIARDKDVNINQAIVDNMLTISAGRDVKMDAAGCTSPGLFGEHCGLVWVGSDPFNSPSGGPLSVTAGGDIITTTNSPIHVSNNQAITLSAGGKVILNLLEALGPVSITAATGNITLIEPIGPTIINEPGYILIPDQGVASLTMSAPLGLITMSGARAVGNITISTGGSLTSSREIVSTSGAVSTAGVAGAINITGNPIGTQAQLIYPGIVLPVAPPGPTVPPPAAPGLASAGAPAFPEILVAGGAFGLPAVSGDGGTIDSANAQRATQQSASDEGGDGTTLLALLSVDADGQPAAVCPPGKPPGSTVRVKDAAGRVVSVACK